MFLCSLQPIFLIFPPIFINRQIILHSFMSLVITLSFQNKIKKITWVHLTKSKEQKFKLSEGTSLVVGSFSRANSSYQLVSQPRRKLKSQPLKQLKSHFIIQPKKDHFFLPIHQQHKLRYGIHGVYVKQVIAFGCLKLHDLNTLH